MRIGEQKRHEIEELIAGWHLRRKDAITRVHFRDEQRMNDWLFAAERVLGILGLGYLAERAEISSGKKTGATK